MKTNEETALREFDWGQICRPDWNACFHLDGSRFCGRSERWDGHKSEGNHKPIHAFVSLYEYVRRKELDAFKAGMEYAAKLGDEAQPKTDWASTSAGEMSDIITNKILTTAAQLTALPEAVK